MNLVAKLEVINGESEEAIRALVEATKAFEAGGVASSELVICVGKAATDVEEKLGVGILALRGPATELVRACQKHKDGAEAMEAALRAATEQSSGESTLVQNELQKDPGPGQVCLGLGCSCSLSPSVSPALMFCI